MDQKYSVNYDAVIIGAGHNGLIAACYLAMAGKSVLILEKNDNVGGATYAKMVFAGVDARLSVYSYLVSLLPGKILTDLDIRLELRRREIASYSPVQRDGRHAGLLISNASEEVTRQSFIDLSGNEHEYRRYQKLQEMLSIFAQKIWPTLLEPLRSKQELQNRFRTLEEHRIWEYMVERPLSDLIEHYLADDTVRGAVFTDAKIGVLTYPGDATLLQNRTFLYHTIGQGTGEWQVPVGGMGALVDALAEKARASGVDIRTEAEVVGVEPGAASNTVHFHVKGAESAVDARYVLFNTSSDIANRCLPGLFSEQQVVGSVFKINMVLNKLPTMKDGRISAREAFTGTLHFNEGYEHMKATFQAAQNGVILQDLPGEIYCHSLTDPTILTKDLQEKGWHTLTLFGLDVPYRWFVQDNERVKAEVTRKYLDAINQFIQEDIRDCLAEDTNGNLCIEAKSPVDLEESLGLPRGNIFHGNLTWPFAEREEEVGNWGVETNSPTILICGSSAKRGGAVSGIPGHNAAMKVLEGEY
jgi:phytoene dehydrogenase-like protein